MSEVSAEVVATGLRFGEGPVWVPASGDRAGHVVCTAVAAGALERIDVETGAVTRVADVGGGANAALVASDGGFLVTQNGGIDFTRTGLYDDPPPYRPATPGIQRVAADGAVSYVAETSTDDGPFLAPNDLVASADGMLWFTDPPHHPPPPGPAGRIHVMAPDGTSRVAARGFHYCNGIALDPDGTPVVIEGLGLLRLGRGGTRDDASREWVTEQVSPSGVAGDGFCVDEDGRYYVATTTDHGIRVLEPDGREVDFLAIPGRGITTNCCFGGDDRRTLFATDGVPGQLVAFEGMPTAGLALAPWPVPAKTGPPETG